LNLLLSGLMGTIMLSLTLLTLQKHSSPNIPC
jgi:hypothetical protein